MFRSEETHRNPRLSVAVSAMAFDASPATLLTFDTALALSPTATCVAIVDSADAPAIRSAWRDRPESTLLLLHGRPAQHAELAAEVVASMPQGPLALLLAGAPKGSGVKGRLALNALSYAARQLEAVRTDLQVLPLSSAWAHRLPRIR